MRCSGLVGVIAALSAPAASAATTSFTTTGEHPFTVPAGVTSVHVVAVGGKGGDVVSSGAGGLAGTATADLAVIPSETLYAEVGGNGGDNGAPAFGAGGANGGGAGGAGVTRAAGGGGASDVRTSPGSVPLAMSDTRVVVAGGGGGAAGGTAGGGGGGTTGVAGSGSSGCAGGGGTQTMGGAATDAGKAGSLGQGGAGGFQAGPPPPGGGGGGGFYGGGGGAGDVCGAGGGGGGSGFFGPGTSNTSFGIDATGQPSVTISYAIPPAVSLTRPAEGAHYTLGQTVTAAYSCTAGAGTTISSCGGPAASGGAIDTSTLGQHTFSVTATDADGGTTTVSATYLVVGQGGGPGLSAVGETRRRWSLATGTTFRFTLDRPAQVTLAFTRHTTGRRVKSKCVLNTRRNRHHQRCDLARPAGKIVTPAQAGANSFSFAGVVGHGRRLRPGSYTVDVAATDSAGHVSTTQTLGFTITR
jgi:hypothetical protein